MGHKKMMEDSLQYSYVNGTDIHMSNHEVNDMYIKESHREARESFKKLRSWGKNLGEFFYISNSINKGIDYLIEEVSGLEAQLAVTTKERNVLIQTVDDLSTEIRNLSAKLSMTQSLPNPGDTHNQEDPEESLEMEATNTDEEDVEGPKMSNESEDQENHINYASNDKNHLDTSPIKDLDNIAQEGPDEKLTAAKAQGANYKQNESVGTVKTKVQTSIKNDDHSEDHIFSECHFPSSTNENLKIHLRNIHSNLEHSEASSAENELINHNKKKRKDKKFKCEQCPYAAAFSSHIKQHIKTVHEKIRNYVCGECDYIASKKSGLKEHIEGVHENKRNHICGECGYAASLKSTLKTHIEGVHKKIRNHVCEDCGYAALRNATLKMHQETVHNIGDKKLKCDLCTYETHALKNFRRHVRKFHPLQ